MTSLVKLQRNSDLMSLTFAIHSYTPRIFHNEIRELNLR